MTELLRKLLGLSVISILFAFASQEARAGGCDNYQIDKASFYAERAGERVLALLGPAQDVITSPYSCSYNSYSGRFAMDVEIRWSGAFNRNNKYWLTGLLTFDDNGNAADFKETGASESWKNYRNASQILGAVVALGSLANQ